MSADVLDPSYKDEAAAELFLNAGGAKLTKAHNRLASALERQGEKLEEFFNTPFTEDNARVMETSLRAVAALREELHRWHHLVYPNQPKE